MTFKGERLDYWVTGFGTGGTLKGVARVLAKERPETKIVVCEPEDAPMLSSGIAQQRTPDGSPWPGHPAWKPHPMQGWSPDFIAKLVGDAVDTQGHQPGPAHPESGGHALEQGTCPQGRNLRGHHLGGDLRRALKVCAEAPKGSTILCMLPDTGERYLSTPLFADISVDMTPEELEIAHSTPSAGCSPRN
jgi:cysteine synthase A